MNGGGGMTRVSVLVDCTIVSGAMSHVLSASASPHREPRAVLLHLRGSRDRVPAALLLTGGGCELDLPEDAAAIALTTPLARVSTSLLAPVTPLSETPLVRASRVLLERLSTDLPAGDASAPRAVDDVLINVVRGILLEHPHSAAADSRDATLGVRVTNLIDARHTDSRLDVSRIARELHTSRRQLYRHAGDDDGGVAAVLARRRVATACDLFDAQPELTVSEVAARAGFSSAARLRAQFLRWTGTTPTEYRRGHGLFGIESAESAPSPLDE